MPFGGFWGAPTEDGCCCDETSDGGCIAECDCDSCTCATITIAGVSDDGCADCEQFNGEWVITRFFNCRFQNGTPFSPPPMKISCPDRFSGDPALFNYTWTLDLVSLSEVFCGWILQLIGLDNGVRIVYRQPALVEESDGSSSSSSGAADILNCTDRKTATFYLQEEESVGMSTLGCSFPETVTVTLETDVIKNTEQAFCDNCCCECPDPCPGYTLTLSGITSAFEDCIACEEFNGQQICLEWCYQTECATRRLCTWYGEMTVNKIGDCPTGVGSIGFPGTPQYGRRIFELYYECQADGTLNATLNVLIPILFPGAIGYVVEATYQVAGFQCHEPSRFLSKTFQDSRSLCNWPDLLPVNCLDCADQSDLSSASSPSSVSVSSPSSASSVSASSLSSSPSSQSASSASSSSASASSRSSLSSSSQSRSTSSVSSSSQSQDSESSLSSVSTSSVSTSSSSTSPIIKDCCPAGLPNTLLATIVNQTCRDGSAVPPLDNFPDSFELRWMSHLQKWTGFGAGGCTDFLLALSCVPSGSPSCLDFQLEIVSDCTGSGTDTPDSCTCDPLNITFGQNVGPTGCDACCDNPIIRTFQIVITETAI